MEVTYTPEKGLKFRLDNRMPILGGPEDAVINIRNMILAAGGRPSKTSIYEIEIVNTPLIEMLHFLCSLMNFMITHQDDGAIKLENFVIAPGVVLDQDRVSLLHIMLDLVWSVDDIAVFKNYLNVRDAQCILNWEMLNCDITSPPKF